MAPQPTSAKRSKGVGGGEGEGDMAVTDVNKSVACAQSAAGRKVSWKLVAET